MFREVLDPVLSRYFPVFRGVPCRVFLVEPRHVLDCGVRPVDVVVPAVGKRQELEARVVPELVTEAPAARFERYRIVQFTVNYHDPRGRVLQTGHRCFSRIFPELDGFVELHVGHENQAGFAHPLDRLKPDNVGRIAEAGHLADRANRAVLNEIQRVADRKAAHTVAEEHFRQPLELLLAVDEFDRLEEVDRVLGNARHNAVAEIVPGSVKHEHRIARARKQIGRIHVGVRAAAPEPVADDNEPLRFEPLAGIEVPLELHAAVGLEPFPSLDKALEIGRHVHSNLLRLEPSAENGGVNRGRQRERQHCDSDGNSGNGDDYSLYFPRFPAFFRGFKGCFRRYFPVFRRLSAVFHQSRPRFI